MCYSALKMNSLAYDQFRGSIEDSDELSLADIAKNARNVCDEMTRSVLQNCDSLSKRVACKKGCFACCSYLVPVSLPEAFLLDSELQKFPEGFRRNIMRDNLECAQKILSSEMPSRFNTGQTSSTDGESAGSWYKKLDIKCPFLCEGICSIYQIRPLACREHLVEGSSRVCSGGRGNGQLVEMPFSMAQFVTSIAANLLGKDEQSLPLPLALVWAMENKEVAKLRWSVETIGHLAQSLQIA